MAHLYDVPIKTSIYSGFSMAILNNQMVLYMFWISFPNIPMSVSPKLPMKNPQIHSFMLQSQYEHSSPWNSCWNQQTSEHFRCFNHHFTEKKIPAISFHLSSPSTQIHPDPPDLCPASPDQLLAGSRPRSKKYDSSIGRMTFPGKNNEKSAYVPGKPTRLVIQ